MMTGWQQILLAVVILSYFKKGDCITRVADYTAASCIELLPRTSFSYSLNVFMLVNYIFK